MSGKFAGFLSKLRDSASKLISNEPAATAQQTSAPLPAPIGFVQEPVSYQGDYAKTLFLNVHRKVTPIKPSDAYNRYFLTECGIKDSPVYHKAMLEEGFLRPATFMEQLQTLTIPELKEILSEFGLPKLGKKADLISRIVDNVSSESVHLPYSTYTALSDKGADFLAEHNDYVLIHRHKAWDIDWHEYDEKKNGRPFYDVVWGIFNERLHDCMQDYSQGSYAEQYYYCNIRNIHLNMSQLLREEGKTEREFAELLYVIYIDVSGVTGIDYYRMFLSDPNEREDNWRLANKADPRAASKAPVPVAAYAEDYSVYYFPAPGLIKSLSDFDSVSKDFVLGVIDRCYRQKLPMQICDKELFTQMIFSGMDGSYDSDAINKKLMQSFIRYLEGPKQ